MSLWHDNLRNLIRLVGEKIEVHREACGEFDTDNYRTRFERRRAADEELKAFFTQEADARFIDRVAHDHCVRMAGIQSTSTGGWTSALQNWKRAAEKRIADETTEIRRRTAR